MKICWVLFKASRNRVERKVTEEPAVPALGDGKIIDGVGYEVFAIARTPHDRTAQHHVLVQEHP